MASQKNSPLDARYWPVPLLRAIPAAALAIVVTFSQGNYSPELGLLSFGGFAVLSAALTVLGSWSGLAAGTDRSVFLVMSAVSLAAGVAALVGGGAGLPLLFVLVSGWAAITGFLELYLGLRSRRSSTLSRDWIFVGALTAVLAIATLLVPADYVQHYRAPDGSDRFLTSSVVVVGLLGVYGAITAVYLVIAGLSLKWTPVAASGSAS